jgi:1-acyl-sn-glycerol-3-phosphate acyltransferase
MTPPSIAGETPVLPAYGWTHAAATALARGLAHVVFSIEVSGREHLPAAGPCLLCANHTSHVDTFALATAAGDASRRLVFLGAHDYFSLLHWRLRFLHRIICLVGFDRRSSAAAAMYNLRMMGACRDDSRIVVLFPEGTRSVDGRMAPFKSGVAMFADRLGMRVIPCRIEGAHAALPKGSWLPRPRPLRVIFGEPVTMPPAPADETGPGRSARYGAFMADIQARVVQLGRPAATS